MKKIPLRVKLQQGIYKIINPFVKLLIRLGLTPNAVTTIGLMLNIGVAVIFIFGGEEGNRGDLRYVGWAGVLILFAGLFDMLDGQVARLGNMSSKFGALYDSVLDRYSELIMFFGICYYLVAHHYFISSLIAFIGMIGSMMVSYTRARSEGLGIENKGGLMQRPERVITVAVAAIACSITAHYIGGNYKLFVSGIPFHIFEPMSVFIIPLTILAVMTNVTAIQRLMDAKKAMERKERTEEKLTVPIKRDSKVKAMMWLLLFTVALSGYTKPLVSDSNKNVKDERNEPVDTFPIPKGIANQLFYVQKTPNTNTVVYELNISKNGQLYEENPVHVFWIRYKEAGQRAELSFIQRVFAYGIKSRILGNGKYELRFVSYKKKPLYLIRSQSDNQYHVYARIAQKLAILHRVYLKINAGGSFWSPNIEYIELKGIDPVTGQEVIERNKV
jgi:phosphatidylinositol phosphate synthase